MSGKIEISRELVRRIADHCKFWKDHVYLEAIADIEPELRALLAAPAVERQAVGTVRHVVTETGERYEGVIRASAILDGLEVKELNAL